MRHFLVAAILSLFCSAAFAQPEREADDQQAQRQEWFYSQRAYPFPQIPAGARVKAIQQIKQMDRLTRSRRQALATASITGGILAATMDSANWTLIGPKPTDLGSTYVTAGRVNAIAIDPRDNNTVYIGAAEGGVWKTTDGGVTWKPLTDDQASLASGAIALDPSNPDIVYVGTGEENFAIDSYYGAGILKSMDGGATWTNIVGPFLRATIGALAIDPANNQILLCSSSTGIYRSTDGAATWTRVITGIGTGVLFDPTNSPIAYAAIGNDNGSASNGVYRSADGGQTWQLTRGSGSNALPVSNVGRIEIAISPSTPTTLYVGIQRAPARTAGNLLGIFKTSDGGNTWNDLNAPEICPINAPQCWYDMTIRVHPKNPDIVFALGSLTILRSMNGGATWSVLPNVGPNRVEIHVDQHFLAFTPDGSKLYIANDGGVYSTTDITSPQVNWTELNDTLAITQFYPGMSVHPTNSDIALAGAQDNGTQRFGGAASWNTLIGCDGGFMAIDPSVPTIAYATCQKIDILRSLNLASGSFSATSYGIDQNDSPRTQFISPFVIDPSNPQTLYFGTYRVWQSKDGAGRWLPISPEISRTGTMKAVSVAPTDSNTVYVGTSDGKIQVTGNAQDGTPPTWTDRSVGLPPRTLTQIAVDPFDPGTAYASFSGFALGTAITGHVFKTTNGGANWADVSGNMADVPVNDLVVDPDLPNTLYAGTDAGVLVTTDGGATWSTLGNGLPMVVVNSLVLHRRSRVLRAATHGRSVWDILVPLASATEQPSLTAISPVTTNAGGSGFVLTVTGKGFVSGSNIRWNGRSRPTNFVDSTELTALIPASDIASVGRAAIAVFAPGRGGSSNATSFTIGPAPAINTGGVVGAAPNPTGTTALAPGSIAALYGSNLAPGVASADIAPPLPNTLSGVTVVMSSVSSGVALFYVSPLQINFQVPWYILSGPASVTITVMQGLMPSSVMTVRLVQYAPAIFTTNQAGTGQGAVLINGSGGALAAPKGAFPGSRPVKKGEFIEIYANGLGAVTRSPAPGAPSPSSPLAATTTPTTVTIGGANGEVSFSGLAPGFVGLYQINVKVPDTAPSGSAVNVSLSIGGVTSNTATIAIE